MIDKIGKANAEKQFNEHLLPIIQVKRIFIGQFFIQYKKENKSFFEFYLVQSFNFRFKYS
jgi:hypothetical protein